MLRAFIVRVKRGDETGTAHCFAENENDAKEKVIAHIGDGVEIESIEESTPTVTWIS